MQTHAVLHQAWKEGLRLCLVLNKIDRLISELQLSPDEAYEHLLRIIETLNGIVGSFHSAATFAKHAGSNGNSGSAGAEATAKDEVTTETGRTSLEQEGEVEGEVWVELDDAEEESRMFSPIKGNVVFCSAKDCWAFSCSTFAALMAPKLGIPQRALLCGMWGETYTMQQVQEGGEQAKKGKKGGKGRKGGGDGETPPVYQMVRRKKKNIGKGKSSLFAQLALGNIWNMYNTCTGGPNGKPKRKKLQRMLATLNLVGERAPAAREVAHDDAQVVLRAVFSKWLPLSDAVLEMVVRRIPPPSKAQQYRVDHLWPMDEAGSDEAGSQMQSNRQESESEKKVAITRKAIADCQATAMAEQSDGGENEAPVVIFVSKMCAVKRSELQLPKELLEKERQHFFKTRHQMSSASSSNRSSNSTTNTGSALAIEADSDSNGSDDCFVAFARVYSGTLTAGQPLFILGPKYSHKDTVETETESGSLPAHCSQVPAGLIVPFIMMGADLSPVRSVPAGNVVGIFGLGAHILKAATVTSTLHSASLAKMIFQATPILKVAVGKFCFSVKCLYYD